MESYDFMGILGIDGSLSLYTNREGNKDIIYFYLQPWPARCRLYST
jgi:hypothetical protein